MSFKALSIIDYFYENLLTVINCACNGMDNKMGFSEIEKQRIKKIVGEYCDRKIPEHVGDQIKLFYKIRGSEVKIIESRPHFIHKSEWIEHPIARLKYDANNRKWSLYWQRASGRWEKYPDFEPTNDLSRIIDEIDKDQWHVFWG